MATLTNTTQDYALGATVMTNTQSVWQARDWMLELSPYRAQWLARCTRYQLHRAYYRGTVYNDYPDLISALKLYSGIRQIFGPLRRAVRVDVAKVPGGWDFDPGNPDERRAPVPDDVKTAVRQIRVWSNSSSAYSRIVLHGAVAGEFGLMVAEDWQAKIVQVVPLRPDEVVCGEMRDGTRFGLIIKPGLYDRAGAYEYAQIVTPRQVLVFRNGQIVQEQPNRTGAVNIWLSPYLAGEDGYGETAFSGAQELLDRVNDAASQVLDVLQRNAEPIVVVSGVDDVQFRTGDNAMTLPRADAKAYTLDPNLAIADALALIDKVLAEFKQQLPQLSLDLIQSRNDLAYETVMTLLTELVDHISDVRTHVDNALAQAERAALVVAQSMGLFPGVDPALHALDSDRPVFPRLAAAQAATPQAQPVSMPQRPARAAVQETSNE